MFNDSVACLHPSHCCHFLTHPSLPLLIPKPSTTHRGLSVEEFPLLLLSVGEYIAARRNLGGFSKADALAGKRAQVSVTRGCSMWVDQYWCGALLPGVRPHALPTCSILLHHPLPRLSACPRSPRCLAPPHCTPLQPLQPLQPLHRNNRATTPRCWLLPPWWLSPPAAPCRRSWSSWQSRACTACMLWTLPRSLSPSSP